MKAIMIEAAAPAGRYRVADVAPPALAGREVLVRVRAAALNRADAAQRAGRYRQHATARGGPPVAGLEIAGEVVALGPAAIGIAVGDRVMGMCSGGFAELAAVDERLLLPVPDRLGWEEATALPVALLTGHDAIVTQAELRPGEAAVIHGASSSVGLMAVQIAKLLGAEPVIAIVRDLGKAATVTEAGADVVCDLDRFEGVAAERTQEGVGVVIDHVGGPSVATSLRTLAVGGRLVSVGRLGGAVATIDLDLLACRNLRLLGTSFRTRTLDAYAAVATRARRDLLPAVSDGRLVPLVDQVFAFADIDAAHRHMLAARPAGKVVLRVGEG